MFDPGISARTQVFRLKAEINRSKKGAHGALFAAVLFCTI